MFSPAMATVLVERALFNGVLKSDLTWRMGYYAACAVQMMFLLTETEGGISKDQTAIRKYLEHGEDDNRLFLGIKKVLDRSFDGIELFCMGGAPVIGQIVNMAVPADLYRMTESGCL